MISTPEIVQTQSEPAAVIPIRVARSEMMKVFGPAVGELMSVLSQQGVAPIGAVFAHHLKMNPETFDFQVGVRVALPIVASGRVMAGELPAARIARTVYTGPYEGLGSAWGEFSDWLSANGHTSADDLWEVYTTGPQSTPDPGLWRTELNRPLKD